MPRTPATPRPPRTPRPAQPQPVGADPDSVQRGIIDALYKRPTLSQEDLNQAVVSQVSGATPAQVEEITGGLFSEGYIYPPVEGFWALTYPGSGYAQAYSEGGAVPKSPQTTYTKAANVDVNEFIDKIFPTYYQHFKSTHPELYDKLTSIEKNPHNYRKMAEVAWKILNGDPAQLKSIRFNKDDPDYKRPKSISSVEQAIAEVIRIIQLGHPQLKGTLPDIADNYPTAQAAYKAVEGNSDMFLKTLGGSIAPGSVVSKTDLEEAIKATATSLGLKSPRGGNKEVYASYLLAYVNRILDKAPTPFFLDTTPQDTIVSKLSSDIKSGQYPANTLIQKFRETGGKTRKDVDQIGSKLFSDEDYSGLNLSGTDFSSFTITGTNFSRTELKNTVWNQATVKGCNFQGADLTSATMAAASFKANNIEGANFESTTFETEEGKPLKLKDNTGTPLNYAQRSIEPMTEVHKTMESLGQTYNFGLGPVGKSRATMQDEEVVAKVLRHFLDKHQILTNLHFAPTLKLAALDESVVSELKQWIADKEYKPQFITYIQNPKKWWADLVKGGGVPADFSKEDVTIIFSRISKMGQPQEKQQPKQQIPAASVVDQKVKAFLNQYGNEETVTKEQLLSLLSSGDGQLAKDLQQYPDQLGKRDLYRLYTAVVQQLNMFHEDTAIPPKHEYTSLPTSAYTTKVFGNNYGTGVQFIVALRGNWSGFPPKDAELLAKAWDDIYVHFDKVLCWTRIYPLTYRVESTSAAPEEKYVWQITEIQNDVFQKLPDLQGWKEEDVKRVRQLVRSWPENMMNAVLKYAQTQGVDEVWVPPGKSVAEKTAQGNWEVADWSPYYDRPAKLFGGQLKNVGVNQTLDPKTSYKMKANEFYVIPLKGGKKASLKFSDMDPNDLSDAVEEMQTFVPTFVEQYKGSQPELSKYVTDELVAEKAFQIFLTKLGAAQEVTAHDVDFLKTAVRQTLGYVIPNPPYHDWLNNMVYADVYIKSFIKAQKEATPGIASDEELARDAVKMMTEAFPHNGHESGNFHKFLQGLKQYAEESGFGDITATAPSVRTPSTEELTKPQDSPGAELVGPQGEMLPGTGEKEQEAEKPPSLSLNAPSEKEMINELLDELSTAQAAGDTAKVDRIKRDLQQLTAAQGLKFHEVLSKLTLN